MLCWNYPCEETRFGMSARQRMVRWEIHYNRVSRFIEDIPKEVLAENETANVQPKEKKERPETAHATGRCERHLRRRLCAATGRRREKKEDFPTTSGIGYGISNSV